MKQTAAIFLLALSFGTTSFPNALAQSPAANAGKILTLDDALAAAMKQSTDVQRAALSVNLANLDRKLVDYQNDPKFNLSGIWYAQVPRLPAATARDQLYSATASTTLYDFGRIEMQRRIADEATRIKELSVDEVKDLIFWKVVRAWLNVAQTSRISDSLAQQVSLFREKLKNQKYDYEQGLRPESDVVAAEVDLGKAQLTAQAAADDVTVAKAQLGVLIAYDKTPQSVPSDYTLPAPVMQVPAPSALQNFMNALKPVESSVVRRLGAQRASFESSKKLVDTGNRPVLSGQIAAQEAGVWNDPKPTLGAQLQLSWDIPYSGIDRDEIERISVQQRDIDIQLDAEVRTRRDRETVALAQVTAAVKQSQAVDAQRILLERQVTLVSRRYESGKATALELSTAETDLLNIKLDQVRLLNALQNALVDVADARASTDIVKLFR